MTITQDKKNKPQLFNSYSVYLLRELERVHSKKINQRKPN